MKETLRPSLTLFVAFSIITGCFYPVIMTWASHVLFAPQASGSLIWRDGKVIGSHLIGQSFSGTGYFWSRPSATSPNPDNAMATGGSNLGPSNPALVDAVKARVAAARGQEHVDAAVPADLVTTSASGIDPDISPQAAQFQVERIASARGLPVAALRNLVQQHVQGPQWGFLGEARVNVLELNLALDALAERR